MTKRVRRIWTFGLAPVLVAVAWELYKVVGPQDGGTVFGWTILPRANDTAMPHVWEMLSRYGQPENRASDTPILVVVLRGPGSAPRSRPAGPRGAYHPADGAPAPAERRRRPLADRPAAAVRRARVGAP